MLDLPLTTEPPEIRFLIMYGNILLSSIFVIVIVFSVVVERERKRERIRDIMIVY